MLGFLPSLFCTHTRGWLFQCSRAGKNARLRFFENVPELKPIAAVCNLQLVQLFHHIGLKKAGA